MVNYQILNGAPLQSLDGHLFDFVLAGNGVFLRAERPDLKVQFPIANCMVKGLPEMEAFIEVKRFPGDLLEIVLQAAKENGKMEIFFNIQPDGSLSIPEQNQTPVSCWPVNAFDPLIASSLIDIHSHHAMSPYFSPTDNAEQTGFRIYAVIGHLDKQPKINIRVGVYGYFWQIPALAVFDALPGVLDCYDIAEEEDFDLSEVMEYTEGITWNSI